MPRMSESSQIQSVRQSNNHNNINCDIDRFLWKRQIDVRSKVTASPSTSTCNSFGCPQVWRQKFWGKKVSASFTFYVCNSRCPLWRREADSIKYWQPYELVELIKEGFFLNHPIACWVFLQYYELVLDGFKKLLSLFYTIHALSSAGLPLNLSNFFWK